MKRCTCNLLWEVAFWVICGIAFVLSRRADQEDAR